MKRDATRCFVLPRIGLKLNPVGHATVRELVVGLREPHNPPCLRR
jgi:hypothetical protein